MQKILYERIETLCKERDISIARLEIECGFSNSTIKKWKNTSVPKADRIVAVAKYFEVSTDYLLGCSNIRLTSETILNDKHIIALQIARDRVSPEKFDRYMSMLEAVFGYEYQNIIDEK